MLKADREHIHHVIMQMGVSSRSALILIVSIAVLCALIGTVLDKLDTPEYLSFFLFIFFLVVYNVVHKKIRTFKNANK